MHLEASKVSMPALADLLTGMTDRPVLDMTGLAGNFQVTLDVSIEEMFGGMARSRASLCRRAAGRWTGWLRRTGRRAGRGSLGSLRQSDFWFRGKTGAQAGTHQSADRYHRRGPSGKSAHGELSRHVFLNRQRTTQSESRDLYPSSGRQPPVTLRVRNELFQHLHARGPGHPVMSRDRHHATLMSRLDV